MGPNLKLRRPFIWEDEMMEVRELFRRVDRIRKSGFTGFSTWESPPPSANTLSRNRLRRRQALCSMELSHLNYKEAPFESLNHLQNIRGMCTRIQRQDYPMERRKKDVDLVSRPPLLRRAVASSTIERRGHKRLPFEVGRPHSAPTISIPNTNNNCSPNLGSIPLQYAVPKLTTLYDITQKSLSPSQSSPHKSFSTQPIFDPCPPATSSKLSATTDSSLPCSVLTLEPNVPRTSKSLENMETYGQILRLVSISEMSNNKDHLSFTRSIKSFKKDINNTHELSTNGMDNYTSQIPNLESNERLNTSTYYGWSTSDGTTTTSSDINSTSTFNCKSQSSIEREEPSFKVPISDYFQSKNNSRHSSQSSSTLPFSLCQINSDENAPLQMKGGYASTKSLQKMNTKDATIKDDLVKNYSSCSNDIENNDIENNDIENSIEKQETNYNTPSNSISNSACSMLAYENLGFVGQSNTLTTLDTQWLTTTPQKPLHKTPLHLELKRNGNDSSNLDAKDNEELLSQGASGVVVDDPNILIKHSSDPYFDFRLSMVTMIEEEGLQNQQAELEELFQYYLDLNPKVHHEVLHKVIQDIRVDYLLNISSKI